MVLDVKRIAPKLKVQPLGQMYCLVEGGIQFRHYRAGQAVSLYIPVGSGLRHNKGSWDEVLVGIPRNHISVEIGIERRPHRIGSVAIVRRIKAQLWREWKPALIVEDSSSTPARQQ